MGHSRKHSNKEKDKKRRKEKSHKKDRKSSKRRRHSSSSSSSSSSDDDGVHDALARDRAAVNTLRKILSYFPTEKRELRQVLWNLDNSQSVNLQGIPDQLLRSMLEQLFTHLQLRKSSKGDYVRPSGREPLLQLLGMVFSEPIQPAAPPPPPQQQQQQQPTQQEQQQQPSSSPQASPSPSPDEPAAPGAAAHPTDSPLAPEAQAQQPAAPESPAAAAAAAAPRRPLGPAMPDAALLAAARAAADFLAQEEEREAAELVGPAPPDMMDEADAAPQDEREAEVLRIVRLLRDLPPGKQPDAYDVIGVAPAAPAADIKRRYWKLSLMIHPDKCAHAATREAFQAVSRAAKVLQDSGERSALDAAREDEELRRYAEQVAAQRERERQWRVVRGEEAAGAAGALAGPAAREAWMTELPPERRAVALQGGPSQRSQTAFSRLGIRSRGDTSEWTDTPEARAARQLQAMLEGPSTGPLQLEAPKPSAEAAAMAALLAAQRPKSLLEQHQERQQQQAKEERLERKGAAADKGSDKSHRSKSKDKDKDKDRSRDKAKGEKRKGDEEWAAAHPWRPFDRDKDLAQGGSGKSAQQLLKDGEALKSRFAGAGAQSSFL